MSTIQRASSSEPIQPRQSARVPRRAHEKAAQASNHRPVSSSSCGGRKWPQIARPDVDSHKRQLSRSGHRRQHDDCTQTERRHSNVQLQAFAAIQAHRGCSRPKEKQVRS